MKTNSLKGIVSSNIRLVALAFLVLVFALDGVTESCLAQPIKVDLGMNTGRSDTASPGWVEWQVENNAQVTNKFEEVEVTLRTLNPEVQVVGVWHKPGLATGAKMATDGVVVSEDRAPATLELEITGLKPGKHSLVTYHNAVSGERLAGCSVSLAKDGKPTKLRPTHRVATNEESENAYLEFTISESDKSVKFHIASLKTGKPNQVVLNGIEIDGSNPKTKNRYPFPADSDWHADGDSSKLQLEWAQAPSTVENHIYLSSGADAQEVETIVREATPESPAYLGKVKGEKKEVGVESENSALFYCWRVDSVDREGNLTRGDVWKFRVRQLAFPGAEGYGRFAIGGRGGRIVKVTNLNDNGPGSLRAALELDEPRIVVFDVSGRIHTKSRLIIRNPYLTVAGQTAPGKGICISNYNLGIYGTHDCIVRFVRVRPGNTAGKTLDGMGMASSDHSIIDHCSISWTQDESFSSRGAKNITFQRNLISEALNVAGHKKYSKGTEHGYAASIGGDVGSFHHNLLAHCAGRNWSMAGGIDQAGIHAGRLDIRNNLVYNWSHRTTDGGAKEVNFVNNYYRPGPSTKVFHVIMPQHEAPFGPQEYYVIGNVMEGKYGAKERYAGVKEWRGESMEDYIVKEPFFESYVTTTSAEDAVPEILADVGCNRPVLDEHDKRVIEEVTNTTTTYVGSETGYPGLPDSQEDVGGWEDYPEVHRTAKWDTDGDGMPNWWEEKLGLNPDSAAGDFSESHADQDGNGYSNIEDYLNWMAESGNQVPE